jgi:hypothetical protein
MSGYAIIFFVTTRDMEESPLFFFYKPLVALFKPLQGLLVRSSKVRHHSSDILSYIPQIEPVGVYPMRASSLSGE